MHISPVIQPPPAPPPFSPFPPPLFLSARGTQRTQPLDGMMIMLLVDVCRREFANGSPARSRNDMKERLGVVTAICYWYRKFVRNWIPSNFPQKNEIYLTAGHLRLPRVVFVVLLKIKSCGWWWRWPFLLRNVSPVDNHDDVQRNGRKWWWWRDRSANRLTIQMKYIICKSYDVVGEINKNIIMMGVVRWTLE